MKCLVCQKAVDLEFGLGILVNTDGDCVCSQDCFDKREKIKEHFFEHILTNDEKFAEWLGVPKDWIWSI